MFFEKFLSHLQSGYPETARSLDLRSRLTPLLFCPEIVELPNRYKMQAELIVEAFSALRNEPTWKSRLESLQPSFSDPGNHSALMSFDFHVDDKQNLRLIEINTNASMALMSDLLYEVHGVENFFCQDFKSEILSTFLQEYKDAHPKMSASSPHPSTPHSAVIVDEKPEEQKLFAEFLLYKELFERHGIQTSIADTENLQFDGQRLFFNGNPVDLVYNRHTDFYLESPSTKALRSCVEAKAACVSPHPHEYLLLADKARLLELSQPGALESLQLSEEHRKTISQTLIRTLDVQEFSDPDQLWSERKQWFFKTKQSFGGKAAYRGASISRGMFSQVLSGPYLAQEFVPAPTMTIRGETGKAEEFKYDLRFFVYRNRIQLACARLYNGQMTNATTPGGGVAAIRWV